MNLDMLRMIFLNTAAAVLPFIIVGLVLLAAVSYSPLGRLWVGYLRQRKRDSEALEAMLENAGLALDNLRFDLIKLRTSGLPSALADVTSATQEARALSRDLGAVLDAAEEVRSL